MDRIRNRVKTRFKPTDPLFESMLIPILPSAMEGGRLDALWSVSEGTAGSSAAEAEAARAVAEQLEGASTAASSSDGAAQTAPCRALIARFQPSSWHYGWRSSKHTKADEHEFRAYVFTKKPNQPQHCECLLMCRSQSFTLASSKRAKLRTDLVTAKQAHLQSQRAEQMYSMKDALVRPGLVHANATVDLGLIKLAASRESADGADKPKQREVKRRSSGAKSSEKARKPSKKRRRTAKPAAKNASSRASSSSSGTSAARDLSGGDSSSSTSARSGRGMGTLQRLLAYVSRGAHAHDLLKNWGYGGEMTDAYGRPVANVLSHIIQNELLDTNPFVRGDATSALSAPNGAPAPLSSRRSTEANGGMPSRLPRPKMLQKLAHFLVDHDELTIAVCNFLAEHSQDIRAQRNLDELNRRLFEICEFHINTFLIRHGSSFDEILISLCSMDPDLDRQYPAATSPIVFDKADFGLMLLSSVANDEYRAGVKAGKVAGAKPNSSISPPPYMEPPLMYQHLLTLRQMLAGQWMADPAPLIGDRQRWWSLMNVAWLARKLIKFMLGSVRMSVVMENPAAPVLEIIVRSRLGSASKIQFILDGQRHQFGWGRNMLFGLLRSRTQDGAYAARIEDIRGRPSIRIDRYINNSAQGGDSPPLRPVHRIRVTDSPDLIVMENMIFVGDELRHRHTEAFRRQLTVEDP